ncbi:2-succinyl-5-enolpyruvyl-6-hydroxy-3-cyclohexene-1-carboxylic-acid synthase [Macrococcoides caseolyticum]|uniref:2-succinyl-5-enolpyruvyl-6-hydroxy-3- cyclohexene-1-carboxylic-acid synthase n=1 Tax=Macrococcoides caseolyticum TaxID=69966 RepID=UPI001F23B45F|nr:2-succinyl-5-enolpyruvyl-6-hydroxy-3-cyclohexene-1-carboxylic-acid synthase [Macrococcus caseolyticus]MCE4957966.1 2-succinyl-5-enolpyruvyl-6-hydroxy-3-cyclohexene-1-carboxylic-acid synthase [Macrococcus caseolyticus]
MNEALTEQVFHFVKSLYDYGVKEIVISPGSRSTPVAIACELHPLMKTYIHPDERSAGFYALGLMKATKQPVAILCTSGTAASNYVPAVSECFISNMPLVVITSDRPHELRNVGAPQAINQVGMYRNFVHYERDFPVADSSNEVKAFTDAVMMQARCYFSGPMKGPVHFNLPFREPLMPNVDSMDLMTVEPKAIISYQKLFDVLTVKHLITRERGVIIAGDCQNEDLTQMLIFSTIHNVPIIADPLSQIRDIKHPNIVTTGDSIFKVVENITPGYIIRVGNAVVSKAINQWLKQIDVPQILVQPRVQPNTFPKVPDVFVEITANDFFRQIAEEKPPANQSWLKFWQTLNDLVINHIMQHTQTVSDEGSAIYQLFKQINKDEVIFLGNSMPIRDCDTFFTHFEGKPYCNRGANGIDGVVSTALGMARHKKVTLIIGDISFYHDMNGLIMERLIKDFEHHHRINIIVMNNNGGGIFSYLPQYEDKAHFERLFGTPLDLDFEHTAKLYHFKYKKFNVFDEITLPKENGYIIEITSDREENLVAHRKLIDGLKEKLNA